VNAYDLSDTEYLLIGKFIHKFSELEFSIEFTLLSFTLPSFKQTQFKEPPTSPWFLASMVIDKLAFNEKITILKNFINTHMENYFISREDPNYTGKVDSYKKSIKELNKSLSVALSIGEHRNQLVHSFYFKQEKFFYSTRSKINDKRKIKTEKYSESNLKELCDSVEKTFHAVHTASQYLSFLRSENLKYLMKNDK
jgi:hypothetical protein